MAEIRIKDLCFAYENAGKQFPALKHLDLTVGDGDFLCLIGPSGGGKSTLLRLLAGLEKPSSGEILIDNKPVTGPGSDRMIVFQDYTLFPWMTARDNIVFALRKSVGMSSGAALKAADRFLELVHMEKSADLYPSQMSGGMKQRIAIARALALDTDILLLDEPFGALDVKTRVSLQKLIIDVSKNSSGNKTVVFVTHDITEAVRLGDRIIFLSSGKIDGEIPIGLSRPRDENDDLTAYRNALIDMFGNFS